MLAALHAFPAALSEHEVERGAAAARWIGLARSVGLSKRPTVPLWLMIEVIGTAVDEVSTELPDVCSADS